MLAENASVPAPPEALPLSSSVIVTVAALVAPRLAPLTLLSRTEKASVGSATLSLTIGMRIVRVADSPAAQVSVPLVAV